MINIKDYQITKDDIENSRQFSSVYSIFNNKFDINWDYRQATQKTNKITMHASEEKQNAKFNLGIIDDGSIVYEYNSNEFRSDEFSKSHDNKHILFSGCSETEGVGDNIEKNWSHMTYSSIKLNEGASGYYNLGLAGGGYPKIISNIFIYIEKFGNPDAIFILFPNISRWVDWIDDNDGYLHIGLSPYSPDRVARNSKDDSNIKTLMSNLVQFVSMMKIFEKYCETNGIKLFWATWDKYDEKNYQVLSENGTFKNFVHLDMMKFEEDLGIENMTYKEFIDMRGSLFRRDVHLGQKFHDYFSQIFLSEYNKEIDNANL